MDSNDRRGQILDSAQAVFIERGLRAATIDEITSRAGIGKGTFYLYFESKDAALVALRERLASELLGDVEVALKKKNRVQAVSAFVDAVVDFKVRHRTTAEIGTPGPGGFQPAESERALTAALGRILAGGARAGDFDLRDPQALAALLHGSLRALDEAGSGEESDRLRAAAQDMFRAVLVRKHRKK